MKHLIIGDVHCTPDELDDCEGLLQLIDSTVDSEGVDFVTFMGDQYHTHDVLNVRCIDFWRKWFGVLSCKAQVTALVGNHDQVSPSHNYPHAMLAHDNIYVVDKPRILGIPGCAAMPYYHSPEEFIEAAEDLVKSDPGLHTLFCHATLQGARYENGFFAKDAIDIARIPFKRIFSGHIHSPQKCGKAIYVGAPRWRTRSDSNIDRHLWLLEHQGEGLKLLKRIPTDTACKKILTMTDLPGESLTPVFTKGKDRLMIDVFGPDEKYVRDREAVLKAEFGAETRGFPERKSRGTVSEAKGIETSFEGWFDAFKPQHGTEKAVLKKLVEERIYEKQL